MSWIKDWLEVHPAPPRQIRPKGVEISYSQIRAYLDCPWLHKIIYADFKRPPLNPKSALGISIHKALEAFHREDGSSLERLLELYDENWVHSGFATPQEQLEWHRKGEKILGDYWRQELDRRSQIIGVEKEFLFPLGPHQVRGMIDRIDRTPEGECEIIDYKTHLDLLSEEDAAENLQLMLYGLGARESLGLDPAWLSLYYVAAGKKVSVRYDPKREDEVKALVERVADLVASSRARTPDTTHCPACDFRRSCPHSAAKEG